MPWCFWTCEEPQLTRRNPPVCSEENCTVLLGGNGAEGYCLKHSPPSRGRSTSLICSSGISDLNFGFWVLNKYHCALQSILLLHYICHIDKRLKSSVICSDFSRRSLVFMNIKPYNKNISYHVRCSSALLWQLVQSPSWSSLLTSPPAENNWGACEAKHGYINSCLFVLWNSWKRHFWKVYLCLASHEWTPLNIWRVSRL